MIEIVSNATRYVSDLEREIDNKCPQRSNGQVIHQRLLVLLEIFHSWNVKFNLGHVPCQLQNYAVTYATIRIKIHTCKSFSLRTKIYPRT